MQLLNMIQLKEKYLTEKEKIHELESKIEESAKVTAARREQLLTDPNKFTDKCSPGFRSILDRSIRRLYVLG